MRLTDSIPADGGYHQLATIWDGERLTVYVDDEIIYLAVGEEARKLVAGLESPQMYA